MTLSALQHISRQTCETAEAIRDLAQAGDAEAHVLLEASIALSKAIRSLFDRRLADAAARLRSSRRCPGVVRCHRAGLPHARRTAA